MRNSLTMRKKPAKSKEEKLAENYFPVDEDNLKFAVEKQYKPKKIEVIQLSKPKRKVTRKTSSTSTTSRYKKTRTASRSTTKSKSKSSALSKVSKAESYVPPKISLKK